MSHILAIGGEEEGKTFEVGGVTKPIHRGCTDQETVVLGRRLSKWRGHQACEEGEQLVEDPKR